VRLRIAVFCVPAIVALVSGSPPPAQAQTALYGTFTAGNLSIGGLDWIYGGQIGLYHDFDLVPMVHVGLDGRAQILDRGQTKLISGLIGPRVAIKPWLIPIRPYAEVLIGAGHTEFPAISANFSETSFEYQVAGGLDLTFFPHLDWRMGEFTYGGFSGLSDNLHPKTASTGLVIRF
jgi:hypothetical protein